MDGRYITHISMRVAGNQIAGERDPGFGDITGFEDGNLPACGVVHVSPYRSPAYGFEDDSSEGRTDRVDSY